MTQRKIFGITGLKGAGKDTAGHAILDKIGGTQINFADPLKQICGVVFGLTAAEMSDPVLKETILSRWPYESPRKILQTVGIMFREAYPGVWTNKWRRTTWELDSNIVVTDYRFADEAGILKQEDAVLIKVIRPGVVSDGHVSEQPDGLPCDVEVLNTSISAVEFEDHVVGVLGKVGLI